MVKKRLGVVVALDGCVQLTTSRLSWGEIQRMAFHEPRTRNESQTGRHRARVFRFHSIGPIHTRACSCLLLLLPESKYPCSGIIWIGISSQSTFNPLRDGSCTWVLL